MGNQVSSREEVPLPPKCCQKASLASFFGPALLRLFTAARFGLNLPSLRHILAISFLKSLTLPLYHRIHTLLISFSTFLSSGSFLHSIRSITPP